MPWPGTPPPASSATSWPSPRAPRPKACSTWAPTTASSRSARTAARPGASSSVSRACPTSPTSPASRPVPTRPDTVYAAFDNHKTGDFKPYLLRSRDRGRTWESIAAGLPERGSVYTVRGGSGPGGAALLRHGVRALLQPRCGQDLVRSSRSCPTIAVKDLAIQAREGDLVVATFGRGFYILDDLTPLREAQPETAGPRGPPLRSASRPGLRARPCPSAGPGSPSRAMPSSCRPTRPSARCSPTT